MKSKFLVLLSLAALTNAVSIEKRGYQAAVTDLENGESTGASYARQALESLQARAAQAAAEAEAAEAAAEAALKAQAEEANNIEENANAAAAEANAAAAEADARVQIKEASKAEVKAEVKVEEDLDLNQQAALNAAEAAKAAEEAIAAQTAAVAEQNAVASAQAAQLAADIEAAKSEQTARIARTVKAAKASQQVVLNAQADAAAISAKAMDEANAIGAQVKAQHEKEEKAAGVKPAPVAPVLSAEQLQAQKHEDESVSYVKQVRAAQAATAKQAAKDAAEAGRAANEALAAQYKQAVDELDLNKKSNGTAIPEAIVAVVEEPVVEEPAAEAPVVVEELVTKSKSLADMVQEEASRQENARHPGGKGRVTEKKNKNKAQLLHHVVVEQKPKAPKATKVSEATEEAVTEALSETAVEEIANAKPESVYHFGTTTAAERHAMMMQKVAAANEARKKAYHQAEVDAQNEKNEAFKDLQDAEQVKISMAAAVKVAAQQRSAEYVSAVSTHKPESNPVHKEMEKQISKAKMEEEEAIARNLDLVRKMKEDQDNEVKRVNQAAEDERKAKAKEEQEKRDENMAGKLAEFQEAYDRKFHPEKFHDE